MTDSSAHGRPSTSIRGLSSRSHVYEAALEIASDLQIDAVLQRVVDFAREVVPAKYAALGVCDDTGRIVQFITSGIDPATVAAIGPLPHGDGLLGVLIREGQPLRVPDISADPRSIGFPPNHPPMRSLLGVPIKRGDLTLGDLYLTEPLRADQFSEDDLATLQVLAIHAATAIERANLHREVEESQRDAEEQRDQLRGILDNLPSGVLIQSGNPARNELVNESAFSMIFGKLAPVSSTTTPRAGRDYRLLLADGSRISPSSTPGARALKGELVRNQQLMLERADGQLLPILVQAAPLRDVNGEINRAVVVWQDITKLRESEQLKDDFLSLVSHEFRTPLTSINGGARLLASEGSRLEASVSSELLHDIVTESARLDRMLENMLSVAAIMAGRVQPETEPVLIEPLVRKVVAEINRYNREHEFVVDMPIDLPPAESDSDSIVQVLRNLYENAIKYSPEGGAIRTGVNLEDRWMTLSISDTGVGIAPDAVPHLFQRFRRPGADPSVRGMGLGLYLSRMLIEALGGRIYATSPGVGKGATISIVLPLVEDETSGDDSPGKAAP